MILQINLRYGITTYITDDLFNCTFVVMIIKKINHNVFKAKPTLLWLFFTFIIMTPIFDLNRLILAKLTNNYSMQFCQMCAFFLLQDINLAFHAHVMLPHTSCTMNLKFLFSYLLCTN